MRAGALSLVLLAGTTSASALAGIDAEVDYAAREVDFHRFTDQTGAKSGLGTDIAVSLRYQKTKEPWALGVYFSQQSYDLDASQTYFGQVRASELGVMGLVRLGDKSFVPEIAFAADLQGSVTGETTGGKVLTTSQGGGLPSSGETLWQYSMEGFHVRPGLSWNLTKGACALIGVDISSQDAHLSRVTSRTIDVTGTYSTYAKTKTDFDSFAVVLGARADL